MIAGKLGANAVCPGNIGNGAITTAKLGAGSVIAARSRTASITTNKLNNDAVTTPKLANESVVDRQSSANGSVTAAKLERRNRRRCSATAEAGQTLRGVFDLGGERADDRAPRRDQLPVPAAPTRRRSPS